MGVAIVNIDYSSIELSAIEDTPILSESDRLLRQKRWKDTSNVSATLRRDVQFYSEQLMNNTFSQSDSV